MKSMSFTVFSYNATVLLIQPNPTQPNPWMDPTHVHLCLDATATRPSVRPAVRRSVGRADADIVNFVAGLQNNIVRRRLAQTRRV